MLDRYFTLSGRLSVFLDSPIEMAVIAGIIAALLYPIFICSVTPRCLVPRIVVATLMISLLGVMILTQSRGPLLAAILTCMFTQALPARFFGPSALRRWHLLLAAGVLVAGCLSPGVSRRIAQIGEGDPSVSNRFAVARLAAPLVRQTLLHGLGPANVGKTYSQWYAPVSKDFYYDELSNTWLELAISRSGCFAVACLVVVTAFLLLPWAANAQYPLTSNRSACAGCFWLVSIFIFFCSWATTLSDNLAISLLSVACPLVATWALFPAMNDRRKLVQLLAIAAGATIIVTVVYDRSNNLQEEITVHILDRDRTVLTRTRATAKGEGITATVFIDTEILGSLYGHQLRELMQRNPKIRSLLVVDPESRDPGRHFHANPMVMLFGSTARFAGRFADHRTELLVIDPSVRAPAALDCRQVRLFLPGSDDRGIQAGWREQRDSQGRPPEIIGLDERTQAWQCRDLLL